MHRKLVVSLTGFSSIDTTDSYYSSDTIADPSKTPYASYFPDATICVLNGGYNYYRYTADTSELLGSPSIVIAPPASNVSIYSKPLINVYDPMSLGTTIINQYTGTNITNGLPEKLNGSQTITYDGFGSIKFKGQVYTNIICLKIYQEKVDTITTTYGYMVETQTTDSYLFSTDGSTPLFYLSSGGGTVTQSNVANGGVGYLNTLTLSVYNSNLSNLSNITTQTQNSFSISGLILAPNPAQNNLSISAPNISGNMTAEFINASGTSIRTENISGGYGSIDISDLTPGIYVVKISNDSNQETRRIVKL